jgi:hypothetical protein
LLVPPERLWVKEVYPSNYAARREAVPGFIRSLKVERL